MKVFISTASFAEYDKAPLCMLKEAGIEFSINPYKRKLTENECMYFYKEIDGLIAGTESITEKILESSKKLKVISRCGVGIDNIDMETAHRIGLKIFNTPDAPTQAVAELTVGFILNLLRKICTHDKTVKANIWEKYAGNLLFGKTVGILGLGRIGKKVIELTFPYNITFLAWDIMPDMDFAKMYKITYTNPNEIFKLSDIITIHLPFSNKLKNFVNEDKINLMKKDAFIINTARGELIDEESLYQALKEGRIAGAAIDVFKEEPYKGLLKNLKNVILTPHVGSYAKESRVQMEISAVKNLINALKNWR